MTAAVDVLLLSTHDTDGAGKFTHNLAKMFNKLGMSTKIISLRNRTGKDNTCGFLDKHLIYQIFYRTLYEFFLRIFRPHPEYAFIHLNDLPDRLVYNSNIMPENCKIIVCTFLSGLISPSALPKILEKYRNAPIIFYGVDMNFFTGGCHFARDCTGYLTNCSRCPAVPKILQKRVSKNFDAKNDCYRALPKYTVISSSYEHHQQISNSKLFCSSDIRHLLMAVDSSIYGRFEAERESLKKINNLSIGRVLLLRSSSESRKGCGMFSKAIHLLESLSPESLKDLTIIAIGDHHVLSLLRDVDVRVRSLGYISDEIELASIYAMADFFVNPSFADGGPVMLAQALMSGTPVISNEVGLATDLIQPSINGLILKSPTPEELSKAILKFIRMPIEPLSQMRIDARNLAVNQISEKIYLKQLSALIEELINE